MAAGDKAPALNESTGYPLNGEKLSTAWDLVWQRLEDGEWCPATVLTALTVPDVISGKTFATFMAQAVKAEKLEKDVRVRPTGKNRKRAYYRRVDVKYV